MSTKTLCPYCGVGCGLEIVTKGEQSKIIGDRNHPSSQGMLCVKGATILESLDKDRLQYPLYRKSLADSFERISWDSAYDLMVEKITTARDTLGVESVCMYGSGQMQTEDYYIAQKLLKGCLGTNNFDSNSRLCMSSAVAAYSQSFGMDGPPCNYEDLDYTDCAFIIGSNTAECHPIVFNRLYKQIKRNPKAKMIVVDPRCTKTAEGADLHLAIKPGSDIYLLHGMAHLIGRWGGIKQDFIDNHTEGFAEYQEVFNSYTPDVVASLCGIAVEDLEKSARFWLESDNVLSLWSMGINQSSEGTAKARNIINLHLMTAQIGREGAGPFSLTGQPNAMGGRETGGLAYILPGYRSVKNPQHRQELEEFWQLPPQSISPQVGKDAWQIITDLEKGKVGLLWIVATNPAVSMPNLRRSQPALKLSPFTVYQDAYYPTETSALAHLLLPACQWSEKTGTMTNSERVVTFCPQSRRALGEAKADWEIFAEVGRRLGYEKYFNFANSGEVYGEYVQLTKNRPCDVSGLSHEILKEYGAIQWPFPENSDPVQDKYGKRLYTDFKFHTATEGALFLAYHPKGLAELPDQEYPLILTVGRLYGHWHTMTRTGRIEKIQKMYPEPLLEINPKNALELGLEKEQMVKVISRRGEGIFKIQITDRITVGTIFVPMHWGSLWGKNTEGNALTHAISCPDSKQPELKACAVKIIKI